MTADNFNLEWLLKMRHSPVRNYIIPGLTSWLIGEKSEKGCVRLFECSRDHQENVTPHSHRFAFQAWVLRGRVINRLWQHDTHLSDEADLYASSQITYKGAMGEYEKIPTIRGMWRFADFIFDAGQCYKMDENDIHSIRFSRGAIVLFFEGPTIRDYSTILEPVVDDEVIPTLEVKPWMFKK